MAKYLVTYDLVGTEETSADYTRLIERIKQYPNWGKVQKSVWLVQTKRTASQVFQDLWAYMDANDRLLVIEVSGGAMWINEICDRSWLEAFF